MWCLHTLIWLSSGVQSIWKSVWPPLLISFLRSRQENINNWKCESSWYEQYKRRPFGLNFWSLWTTSSSPSGNEVPLVRGSNAYFWANLESGSKVFFSMFSCYIGIVLHETAWWHSLNIEHFYITRFIKSRQSGCKIMVSHGSKNTNNYIKH